MNNIINIINIISLLPPSFSHSLLIILDPEALKRERARARAQKKARANNEAPPVMKQEEDDDPEFILGHDIKDLEMARGGYLTLADKPILKNFKSDQYEIDEDEDVVEHVAIREKEKRSHNADLKSGKVFLCHIILSSIILSYHLLYRIIVSALLSCRFFFPTVFLSSVIFILFLIS